jgi:hypothetical protein
MAYNVTCECGATAPVAASQAGTEIHCRCGKSIIVPTLSALRATGDDSEPEASALARVRTLLASGKLPAGDRCPLTGKPADVVVTFHVQCEEPWMRRSEPSAVQMAMLIFVLGWLAALFSRRTGEHEVCGNDISIELPVRLSIDAARRLDRNWRQRPLRRLLAKTPAYRDLLKEYPRARISQR